MQDTKGGELIAVVAAICLVPLMIVIIAVVGMTGAPAASGLCAAPGVAGDASTVEGSVAGFSGVQLQNAAEIMGVATDLKLPVSAQILGVQTAIGESTLEVKTYGDAAGPDSRGLFQQRDNGAWGSLEDRMNPRVSATNFFKQLMKVEGWEALEPSTAIHRVQRNDNPNHYTQFRGPATEVVKALAGGDIEGIDSTGACPAASNAVIGELSGKWVNPLPGSTVTSGYGPRGAPAGTAGGVLANFHYGLDLSSTTAASGGTVVAATDMKITIARENDGQFGTRVNGTTLDGKLTIGHYHLAAGSLKVKVGDTVAAGTPLGTEGGTGNVSGTHLHLEFFTGTPAEPSIPTNPTVDPEPILRSKGAL
ncbi:M23 family metallopeptidase [Arthrobacter sp. Soc17.1.1.1]|uniref:M23 family metallopeptidase n=1 Tax=Arthrobacter sp. Soc17.1.1.1 TaxID=3121277 RepID=UPI002FE43A7B